jgi:hypothetical protein
LSFVLAALIGLLLLWLTGLGALLIEGGDCVRSESECQALSDAQAVHRQVLVLLVGTLSIIVLLAVLIGRRLAPAVLLIAAMTTMLLGYAGPASPVLWWVPTGLGLTMLPSAVLALAAAGQVISQVEWRPRWLRSMLYE